MRIRIESILNKTFKDTNEVSKGNKICDFKNW